MKAGLGLAVWDTLQLNPGTRSYVESICSQPCMPSNVIGSTSCFKFGDVRVVMVSGEDRTAY